MYFTEVYEKIFIFLKHLIYKDKFLNKFRKKQIQDCTYAHVDILLRMTTPCNLTNFSFLPELISSFLVTDKQFALGKTMRKNT